MLLQAYRTIRGKKGAVTKAAIFPSYLKPGLTEQQVKNLETSFTAPDEFNWCFIENVSNLILSGLYHGAQLNSSRSIWIPKPGRKDSLRLITIPPFGDKMVQESIRMVLEAIYEPTFISMNVSFGFRAEQSRAYSSYSPFGAPLPLRGCFPFFPRSSPPPGSSSSSPPPRGGKQ
jgi:hypothetical protein